MRLKPTPIASLDQCWTFLTCRYVKDNGLFYGAIPSGQAGRLSTQSVMIQTSFAPG